MRTRTSRSKASQNCATSAGVAARRTGNRGIVLPAVVAIILLLTVAGMALLELSTAEGVQVVREAQYLKALNLAEAGIERTLWRMSDSPGWTDGWADEPLGDGTYSVTVEELEEDWYKLTSTGTVGPIGKTLTLQAKVTGELWPSALSDYGVFWGNPSGSEGTAQVKNNSHISGNVFGYGSIEVCNGASVSEGQVCATGTVFGGGSYTEGEVPDPPPERLEWDTSYYDALIAQAAQEPAGNWTLRNGAQYYFEGETLLVNGDVLVRNSCELYGAGKIVATGDIDILNNCAIHVGIDFIAGGSLTINNCSQIETDGNVMFARDSIKLKNNAASSGGSMLVMTPGTLTLENNAGLRGVFWGGVVGLSNNVSIQGSVYADQFDCIRNNVNIELTAMDFDPPPGVPSGPGAALTVRDWDEREATGL